MFNTLIRGCAPRFAAAILAAAAGLAAVAPRAHAQAGSDACANAPTIVANQPYVGNNSSATSEISQSPCSAGDALDIWFAFIAPADGDYTIDTAGSQLDTTLSVWSSCRGNLIACNDDVDFDNFDYTSLVVVTLTAGQNVKIRVAGYAFDTGQFNLFITPPAPQTTMGACCRGSNCAIESSDACTGAAASFVGADSTCNALSNFSTPCCKADFSHNGIVEVQDIFDFLNAWFASDPRCDINGSGTVEVQDIFDFLNAWFVGC